MKFFIDSAEVSEIKKLSETGLVDGVTTNPSLIAKSGRDIFQVIEEICGIVPGPVSAEVTATDYDNMLIEGNKLLKIAKNITVKLPMTIDGIKACKYFSDKDNKVNMTLCFSASQAILAAKAGAAFISPFVGRLDDTGKDGMDLIEEIAVIYDNYSDFQTEILVASIRHPMHVIQAATLGADVATLPTKILWQLFKHPLTDNGLEAFLDDWKKTGQKIA